MPQLAKEYPGFVRLEVDPARGAMHVTWTMFTGAEDVFTPALQEQWRLITAHGLSTIIVDSTGTSGALGQAEQAYIVSDFFPAVAKTGLEAIVTVLPKSAITGLVAKRWKSSGDAFGFTMLECASVADAQSIARQIKAGTFAA